MSENSLEALAALLRESGAITRLQPERVVRSTLYDLDYHVAVIACAFQTNCEEVAEGKRQLVSHWLKLLQFIAARPTLLPDFQEWARARRRPDLDTWQRMPRGFLGDSTHDRTVEMLIAGGILHRRGDTLQGGERFDVLVSIYNGILERDLFKSERLTLQELSRSAVNKTLLTGA